MKWIMYIAYAVPFAVIGWWLWAFITIVLHAPIRKKREPRSGPKHLY